MPENPKKSPSRSSSSSSGEGRFPVDNLTYDLITVIHEKSQGLAAFDKYLKDAGDDDECRELFEDIRQQDEEAIQQLTQALRDRLESLAEEEAA
jgi:bacterioferritin (cytochrome b1)